jgi:hypothetical protein
MSGHQLLHVVVTDHWKRVGTVDYEDKVKKKFYLDKLLGILKKKGLLTKTRTASYQGKWDYIEIFARKKPLNKYAGIAWVHPKGGGDDYTVNVKTEAENLTIAKKQVREHLIEKLHTAPRTADDFTIKQVKR